LNEHPTNRPEDLEFFRRYYKLKYLKPKFPENKYFKNIVI
jgi:hypothetical protein